MQICILIERHRERESFKYFDGNCPTFLSNRSLRCGDFVVRGTAPMLQLGEVIDHNRKLLLLWLRPSC